EAGAVVVRAPRHDADDPGATVAAAVAIHAPVAAVDVAPAVAVAARAVAAIAVAVAAVVGVATRRDVAAIRVGAPVVLIRPGRHVGARRVVAAIVVAAVVVAAVIGAAAVVGPRRGVLPPA